jgi:hypothetical protein
MLQRLKDFFLSKFSNLRNEKLFKIPSICYRVSGFSGRTKFFQFIQWFLILSNTYAGFSELWFVIKHRDSLIEAADACGTLVSAILVQPKALVYMFKREKFERLREKIKILVDEGLWERRISSFPNLSSLFSLNSVDDKHSYDVTRINEFNTKISGLYLVSAASTGSGYVVRPLIAFVVYHLILHQPYVFAAMPTGSEFFYDISKSPAYELTYFVCSSSIFLRVLMSVSQLKSQMSIQSLFGF